LTVARTWEQDSPHAYSLELLARAITVLEYIGSADTSVGVSVLARKTGIPKTTTYRMLENLARQDMLSRRPDGYVIGSRMRELANLVHDWLPGSVRDQLRPYLVELYTRTGQVVTLGVLDEAEMVTLETVCGLGHASLAAPASRTPAHCSAIGKLLMAHHADLTAMRAGGAGLNACTVHTITDWTRLAAELSRIRRQGVAISHQEHVLGVIEVAMPIVGRHGPIAGVALSRAVDARITQETYATHRQIILAASAALRTLRLHRE
jgi:DNA-binding IclR family transcriptional regulator